MRLQQQQQQQNNVQFTTANHVRMPGGQRSLHAMNTAASATLPMMRRHTGYRRHSVLSFVPGALHSIPPPTTVEQPGMTGGSTPAVSDRYELQLMQRRSAGGLPLSLQNGGHAALAAMRKTVTFNDEDDDEAETARQQRPVKAARSEPIDLSAVRGQVQRVCSDEADDAESLVVAADFTWPQPQLCYLPKAVATVTRPQPHAPDSANKQYSHSIITRI